MKSVAVPVRTSEQILADAMPTLVMMSDKDGTVNYFNEQPLDRPCAQRRCGHTFRNLRCQFGGWIALPGLRRQSHWLHLPWLCAETECWQCGQVGSEPASRFDMFPPFPT